MNTLFEILKSSLRSQARSSISLIISFALIFCLSVFSWVLLNAVFIIWFGSLTGSYLLGVIILLVLNLVIIGGLYIFKDKLFAKAKETSVDPAQYLNNSINQIQPEMNVTQTIDKVDKVSEKEQSLIYMIVNLVILYVIKMLSSKTKGEAEINTASSKIISENLNTQNLLNQFGLKVIDKYLEKRLERVS